MNKKQRFLLISKMKQNQLIDCIIKRRRKQMSLQKQKLAEMVLQKMKQKKQAEQRNRPHYQLLQLNVQFSLEDNKALKQQVDNLAQLINSEQSMLSQLKQNLIELENTGKKTFPIIAIKPEFIASENVTPQFKQFYRKTSNTYMKTDIIKTQKYQAYLQKQQSVSQILDSIISIQTKQYHLKAKNTKTLQQKRYNILKQDVKRRLLIEQQQKTDQNLIQLKQSNASLLREYQIKKQNLQNRVTYCQQLQIRIAQEKKNIEAKYNPLTYRQYLKDVFNLRFKNQCLQKNLLQMLNSLKQSQKISQKYQQNLQKRFAINFIGKTSDSPSKIRGRIQKNLQKQKSKRSHSNPRNLTEIINLKSTTQTSVSNHKKSKYRFQKQPDRGTHFKSLKKHGGSTDRNYSSLTTLRSTLKGNVKTQRTLSTTWGMSSGKKRFSDLQK